MPHRGFRQSADHIRRRQEAMAARRSWAEVSEAILQARSRGDTERASRLLNAYLEEHHTTVRATLYNLAEDDDV